MRILVVGNMFKEVRAGQMIIDSPLIDNAGGYQDRRAG